MYRCRHHPLEPGPTNKPGGTLTLALHHQRSQCAVWVELCSLMESGHVEEEAIRAECQRVPSISLRSWRFSSPCERQYDGRKAEVQDPARPLGDKNMSLGWTWYLTYYLYRCLVF